MHSDDLTTEQLDQLAARVSVDLRYLVALCKRMRQRGFPISDAFWQAAEVSRDATSRLYVELYERSQGLNINRSPFGQQPRP
jgi:hypothetical protein